MKLSFCLALCLIGTPALAEHSVWSLSGQLTNTTDSTHIISAAATLSFNGKDCVIRVDAPLVGSGSCSVTTFDHATNKLIIRTGGPAGDIIFDGSIAGDDFTGKYTVIYPNFKELPQQGTFALHDDPTPIKLDIGDVLKTFDFDKDGKHYNVLQERETAYIYDKDVEYAGIRVLFDDKGAPSIRIEDHQDGAEYIQVSSGKVLMLWHCNGIDGYFEQPKDGYSVMFDRFMKPTHWSSSESQGTTYYAYQRGKDLELYDSQFKYLNIHSTTTSAGRTVWLKDGSDGVTEYFDDKFQPLHWYSAKRDGQIVYAHEEGKKIVLYDSNLNRIEKEHPLWRAFGRGMATGLASYGQALQAQAAQAQTASTAYTAGGMSTQTTQSGPVSYTTTSQQIGNFTYSNTNGSDGYSAQQTRQQIGNFGYVNGTSSDGNISGSTQQIGNFSYGNYTTPSGTWNTNSQQIGNFTYHTITAPDGSVHTGTSQQIGDFVYTNVY